MDKLAQVNVTTLAIGGVAILGLGYLTSRFLFESDSAAQVSPLVMAEISKFILIGLFSNLIDLLLSSSTDGQKSLKD